MLLERSFIILGGLAVLGAFILANSLWAAPSGTLTLFGTVPLLNNIVIAPGAGATNLNITSGENGKVIADVEEISNSLEGYIIRLYSANGGRLKNQLDNGKSTTYTISYGGGTAIQPPTANNPITIKSVSALEGLSSSTSNVRIHVTAYPQAPAGNYSDTLTFSIAAN